MPNMVKATQHTYWYGLPPWGMINPEQVQSSAPLKKETAIKAVEQVPRVTPIKRAHPYRGRLIDRYV